MPRARQLTLLFAALLTLAGATPAAALATTPTDPASGAENCARASLSAAPDRAGERPSESACTRPGSTAESARIAAGCCVATKAGRGGAGPVRLGQAGEDAVRGAYDIGDKVPIAVGGRTRIPDGLTPTTLSEVKNVGSLSYTRQLRDYVDYAAKQPGLSVDLYVRPSTSVSGPLREATGPGGPINLRYIP